MAEILFLGTGADDWDINVREDFFRRNSAALIDRSLMIDCGRHIFDFARCYGMNSLYDNVSDIIITHRHSDHLCRESVLRLADQQKLRIGCDRHIAGLIGEHYNIEYIEFEPFKEYTAGGYKITPVLANHDVVADGDMYAYHYIIKTPDNKTVFYGLDGAWLLRPSWEWMKNYKYDIMVFDCTVGDMDDWRLFEHNTIPMLRLMIKAVTDEKLLTSHGKIIASHFARTLHKPHKETAEILSKINVIASFDGMEIAF